MRWHPNQEVTDAVVLGLAQHVSLGGKSHDCEHENGMVARPAPMGKPSELSPSITRRVEVANNRTIRFGLILRLLLCGEAIPETDV